MTVQTRVYKKVGEKIFCIDKLPDTPELYRVTITLPNGMNTPKILQYYANKDEIKAFRDLTKDALDL